jgi:hypothetical protein
MLHKTDLCTCHIFFILESIGVQHFQIFNIIWNQCVSDVQDGSLLEVSRSRSIQNRKITTQELCLMPTEHFGDSFLGEESIETVSSEQFSVK